MAFPQLNHDDMPLYTQYLIVGMVGYNGRLNPGAEKIRSSHPGSEFVQIVKDRRDSSGKVYTSDKQQIALYQGGWRSGGGSTGSGGGPSGPGAVAANALIKAFTGGGDGVNIGTGDAKAIASPVQGQFTGVHFAVADTKVPAGKSPDAENVDGVTIGGVLSPRPGLIQSTPRRYDSVTGAGPVIGTAYFGRSVNMLSQAFWQSAVPTAVLTYDKSSLGTTVASATRTVSKQVRPAWNPQLPIEAVPPTIRHLTNAAGVVQFVVSMPARYRKTTAQGVVASVDQLVVRRAVIGYPLDRDGQEYTSNAASMVMGVTSIALKNYVATDGSSVTVSESGLAAGTTRWYTAWYTNKFGVTPPATFKVTVA